MSKLRVRCPKCGDSRILNVPDLKVSGRATCVVMTCRHEFRYRGPEAPPLENKPGFPNFGRAGKDMDNIFVDLLGGRGSMFDNMFNKRK